MFKFFLFKRNIKTTKHGSFRNDIAGRCVSIKFLVLLSERQLFLVPVTSVLLWEQLAMIGWSGLNWKQIGLS